MVQGKLPVLGRPTIWITVGQGPTALAVGAGWGGLDIFTLIYPFSPLSPSLWETARYRLKYCLKGPLNPKQPTNQPCPTVIQIVGRPGTGSLPSTIAPPDHPSFHQDIPYKKRRNSTKTRFSSSCFNWLVGCYGFNGSLRQYFCLHRRER